MNAEPFVTTPSRRPIGMRGSRLIQSLARALATRGVTPNAVSVASIFCALLAALLIVAFGLSSGGFWFALLAAFFVFARGICNLVDGLIAIENDKKSPTGAFFNEAPDRVADILLFVATGLAWSYSWMGLAAGLGVSILCVGTAYLRALGKTLTGEDDFRGPFAKPHRVGLLIAGLLVAPFVPEPDFAMGALLAILGLGTFLTIVTRTTYLLQTLTPTK